MARAKLPTFDIRTSRDMLDKLSREIKRLETTDNREDAADLCFNAAVTAWHLHDWVWKDIKDNWPVRARIAKAAEIPGKFKKRDWMTFLRSKKAECPALRYCRIIATASKHGGVELTDDDPIEDLRVYTSPAPDTRWKPRIGSQVRLAGLVFEDAFSFWNEFIGKYGVAEND